MDLNIHITPALFDRNVKHVAPTAIATVDNSVANHRKWRMGHESVATQPTFLQLIRQKNCLILH
jgi:hypothetical protein